VIPKKGVEQARKQLPELIDRAARGMPTVITKHGTPVAAVVPASYVAQIVAKVDIRALRGTGKRLWGHSVKRALRTMRDEWE
jgi:prevent-host-death family protein